MEISVSQRSPSARAAVRGKRAANRNGTAGTFLSWFEVILSQKPCLLTTETKSLECEDPRYNGAVHKRALVGGILCFPPTERASNTSADTKLRSAVLVRANNFGCC